MDITTILFETAKGVGKFFLHPLLYLGLFYAIYLGYIRVKRERKNFRIRVQDGWFEFRTYLFKGLTIGLIFSAISLIIGYTVPLAYIVTAGIVTLLLSLVLKPSVLSPAYTAGLSFFIIMVIDIFHIEVPFLTSLYEEVESAILPGAALTIGLLLIIEGLLISNNASKYTSPKIIRSKRGLKVGVHESKRIWMVPLVFLIPDGAISLPFEYWPIVPIGDESFSLIFIPYWIGFGQQLTMTLPLVGVKQTAKKVLILGVLVTVFAIAGFWYPAVSVIGAGVAIAGRLIIPLLQWFQNKAHPFYFSKNEPGIVILDIIPGSPADKMELGIGEIVRKVNGAEVHNETEFYEALQRNGAYCKLEVIDIKGENRFVQSALYSGEHHELGILFIAEEKLWEKDASSL